MTTSYEGNISERELFLAQNVIEFYGEIRLPTLEQKYAREVALNLIRESRGEPTQEIRL